MQIKLLLSPECHPNRGHMDPWILDFSPAALFLEQPLNYSKSQEIPRALLQIQFRKFQRISLPYAEIIFKSPNRLWTYVKRVRLHRCWSRKLDTVGDKFETVADLSFGRPILTVTVRASSRLPKSLSKIAQNSSKDKSFDAIKMFEKKFFVGNFTGNDIFRPQIVFWAVEIHNLCQI